jgi:hypothetical protein
MTASDGRGIRDASWRGPASRVSIERSGSCQTVPLVTPRLNDHTCNIDRAAGCGDHIKGAQPQGL